MQGAFIEHMTWTEAEAALRAFPVVMIPLGARCKEHGPHLPLNNDFVLAEALAEHVMEQARVLTYPTLPYGFYPAFVDYPGSVSVGRDTFRDFVVDVCGSIAAHGASRLFILNTGISTNWGLEPARLELGSRGILMDYLDLFETGAAVRAAIAEQPEGTHADELETSLMLHLAPDVVRRDAFVRDIHPRKGPGRFTRDADSDRGLYSPTGVYGDATLATEEKGRRYAEAIVGETVAFLERFAREDYEPEPAREQYLRGR